MKKLAALSTINEIVPTSAFRATFSTFCIAETFTAAEALNFKQCIAL